jgi:hypothetical protein
MEWNLSDPFKARSDNHNNTYGDNTDQVSNSGSMAHKYKPQDNNQFYDYDLEEKKKQQEQKKQYHSMLDKQRYEKIQEKNLHQNEDQTMQDDDFEEIEKVRNKKYLEYINSSYKSALEYKKEKEREKRESEVEEERERLKNIQKELKDEENKRGHKKATFVHEAQEVANRKRMIKDFESKQKMTEKAEYQQLANQNYQREVERENNYKNYFKQYDNDMSERMANHMKYVTSAEIEKHQKLDDFEKRRIREVQENAKTKEEQVQKLHLQRTLDANSINKGMIDRIDQERMSKREKYQKLVEERQIEEKNARDQDKRLFEDEELKRKLYREALDYQKNIHEYDKTNTAQIQKNINNKNMNGYGNNAEPQGMIPGIHNLQSIGSKPTLRRAQDDMADPSAFSNMPAKSSNKSYKNLMSSVKSVADFTSRESPIRKSTKYDPITNPIPAFSQNPYILKEKAMVIGEASHSMMNPNRRSRRSLLSSTAEKNILI